METKAIEFLDLGETDIDLRPPRAATARDEVGKPVERLRPEDHVDVGSAAHDCHALLARDAAAYADDEIGP